MENNMLSLFFRSPFSTLFDESVLNFNSGMNYTVDNNNLTVTVDLPGVDEKDIKVEISEDGTVFVKGEKVTKTSSYSVSKKLTLPTGFDTNSAKAELKNGVLTLSLVSKSLPPTSHLKQIPVTTSK
jgi:HSP20 family protein